MIYHYIRCQGWLPLPSRLSQIIVIHCRIFVAFLRILAIHGAKIKQNIPGGYDF